MTMFILRTSDDHCKYEVKFSQAFDAQKVERTKEQIVREIKSGGSVVTLAKNGEVSDVHIYEYDGVEYLRTDKDNVAEDNIGNLPRL